MTQSDLPALTILAEEARRSPVRVSLDLSAAERAVLAADNGLASVETFHLKATATGMKGRKLRVEGRLKAEITYLCGVSLQQFPAVLDVPFEQFFGDEPPAKDSIDIDPFDDSDIEPLVNGAASISDLAYQLFTLSLDPYPRHPDLAPPGDEPVDDAQDALEESTSPFAALKDLKL